MSNSDAIPIRVSLVEDDGLTRDSLVKLIKVGNHFEFIGAYDSAEKALVEVRNCLPDVLLVDIKLPGKSGIECTASIKSKHPAIQVLILTTYSDTDLIFEALRAGASGYLLKRSSPIELRNAIKEVHQGGSPMSASIARLVVSHFHRIHQPSCDEEKLTLREREVFNLLAKGLPYKEVAECLNVSLSTINSHVEAIYRKLHVQSRTEAILKMRPR